MSDFSNSELRRLDLTLLLVFLGLLRRRKASTVAGELGLTPSGVSQALKRLRDVFGDALFLRRPHGMEPTALALRLERPVQEAVEALRGALGAARRFDPATATGLLRLAAPDSHQAVLVPALMARLTLSAPGLRLSVLPLGRGAALDALAEGRADLALGFFPERPAAIRAEPLHDEGYRVAGLPRALPHAPRITLDAYCAADHILVSPGGDMQGVVDAALAAAGRSRRVVLALPAFLPALAASAATGALVTLPARIARAFAPRFDLATAHPPLAIRPFTVAMVWHRRDDGDPRLGWIRAGLRALSTEGATEPEDTM
jgi:DNA-binding transcriptional LysR family regulator